MIAAALIQTGRCALAIALLAGTSLNAQELRLLSRIDPSDAPSGAGGDSWVPILTPAGRFVVFASSANNLLLASNRLPIPARVPATLNVYLRDRVAGTNTLVSVNLSGLAGGNGDSMPAGISSDGRYVLFESTASDLVANDTNNASDVFVRDIATEQTLLVSAGLAGSSGNGISRAPVMTPDGRYVAFLSSATNLIATDTNGVTDVFVRDLQSRTTILASVGIQRPLSSRVEAPAITADGRFVAFVSSITNDSAGSPQAGEIFIRDLVSNVTVWASSYASTVITGGNVTAFNHVFSADGRFLAYEAAQVSTYSGVVFRFNLETGLTELVATNAAVQRGLYDEIHDLDLTPDGELIAYVANDGGTDGRTTCLRVWDAQTGDSRLVSTNLDGSVPVGSLVEWPVVDPSGRYIAFVCSATNMVTNSVAGSFHLYRHEFESGTTSLVDVDTNGVGAGVTAVSAPRLSATGQIIAFEAEDGTLVSADRNRSWDTFVSDSASNRMEMISAHDSLLPSSTPNGANSLTLSSVSADGRYVVFSSEADNLPGATNGFRNIMIRDLAAETTLLASVATNGLAPNGISSEQAITADGRFVAFTSAANNLLAGDTNTFEDIFVRDLQTGTTTLVSVGETNASASPSISTDGRFVLFWTYPPGGLCLKIRDRTEQRTVTLMRPPTTGGASMTPDGRYVGVLTTFPEQFYVWECSAGMGMYTNAMSGVVLSFALAPDAKRVAWWVASTTWNLFVFDLRTRLSSLVASAPPLASLTKPTVSFSDDGYVLLYTARTINNTNRQVFCYDFLSRTNLLVSAPYISGEAGNGPSDSPVISAGSRFVAYRSTASNLVAGDANGQPDIFLFDRFSGKNVLVSGGGSGAGNRSLLPVFSSDGSTLVFESWASELEPRDFNSASDIFGRTLLMAVLVPGTDPNQGPWISWPWMPGKHYHVECLDALGANSWQTIPATITNAGVKGWLQDPSPSAMQRFYRVISD